MSDNKVSVIGIGIMGNAIATRLLECKQQLMVFDIDPAKLKPFVDKGASAASSPREATERTDFVILSLNTAAIVERAVFGPDGVAEGGNAEKLLIDMSSIDPAATQRMAERLRKQCGMRWLDAPLSGGVPGALAGKLTVMAGGHEGDFTAAKAVMRHLSANFSLMGGNGAGQTVKLVNQLLAGVTFLMLAEAIKLAECGGVDPSVIPAALAGGRADSRLLQEFMGKMANRDMSPTGRLDNMLKDLETVQAFAMQSRTPLPITGLATELHRLMVAAGLGPEDSAAIMKFFDGKLA